MILSKIETIVLGLIGDKYSELSTDTNRTADFSLLHDCVNLAREEIKKNARIPSLLSWSASLATVASTKAYNLPTDFDIPVKVFYTESGSEWELEKITPDVLLEKLSDTTGEGSPDYYMILGQLSGLVQIEFYDTPNAVGAYRTVYLPILTEFTTASQEDVLMKKYPLTVINFATAFAWEILKKDMDNYAKFYALGMTDCAKIDQRELNADSAFRELPNPNLVNRRRARLSK